MILKDIINKSYYGTIGYISSKDDLILLERYIVHNLPVLKKYKGIIVATNYNDLGLAVKNAQLWQKYFPKCKIINLKENRGHNFGTADLDNALFDYCKNNKIEWLCKVSNDVVLTKEVLNIKIKEADFYYLEGIGYGGLANNNFDNDKILNEYFFPQTNFYLINVNKTDYLNDVKYLDKTYNKIKSTPPEVYQKMFGGKPGGMFPEWACEYFLADCVKRNKLDKYHLLSEEKYVKLLELVKQWQIHDCSHKNIMIEGICHYHYVNQKITLL
jgi:hypothetical protein